MTILAVLLVAWGALAFGAVYPWAYWPLFGVAALTGAAGIVTTRGRRYRGAGWPVILGIIAVLAAIAVQLVPLPVNMVASISPHADRLLRELNVAYAAGVMSAHSLSIDPLLTEGRLIELIAFALLLIGLSRTLTGRRAELLANAVIALGSVVALMGIVQKSTGTDRIYGLWTPFDRPFQIFGPFVNRNHFAGWMIMPLSLGIGIVCGRVTTAMTKVRQDWRSRAIWWSSPEASQLLLAAGAIVLMAFAIVLTRSRSGTASLGAVILLAVCAVVAQTRSAGYGHRGVAAAIVLGVLGVAAASWAGTEPVIARFHNDPAMSGRLDAWRAALRMAADFSRAGTGVNTFATAMLFYQPQVPSARWEFAHNDYLQMLAEGGALVVVPFIVCAVVVVRKAIRELRRQQPPMTIWVRLGAVIGLLGVGFQETVDFSLQLPGISALFCVLVALTLFTADG